MADIMRDGLHPVELPDTLALAVRREESFRTDIVETGSGFEYRNAVQARPRRRYVLETGPRPPHELQDLLRFFEARRGRQFGFLLRDWLEPHSGTGDRPAAGDQPLLPLDEAGRRFGLQKVYGVDSALPPRPILKPVPDTLLLARDGRPLAAPQDYAADAAQGTVTLTRPLAADETLTAGFFFYVPVRFDADRLEMTRTAGGLAALTPLPVIEIPLTREPA